MEKLPEEPTGADDHDQAERQDDAKQGPPQDVAALVDILSSTS
jgi:hypothetical protein